MTYHTHDLRNQRVAKDSQHSCVRMEEVLCLEDRVNTHGTCMPASLPGWTHYITTQYRNYYLVGNVCLSSREGEATTSYPELRVG